MVDSITPEELESEMRLHLPRVSQTELRRLTILFLKIAAGKHIVGNGWLKSQRDKEIRAQFNGRNIPHLARRFSLSGRQIRRIATKK